MSLQGSGLSILLVQALCMLPLPGYAQSYSEHSSRVLNRYIDFTNESLHVLYAFREGLEDLNRSLVLAIEQGDLLNPAYDFSDIYRDGRLFTFLKGTCTRTSENLGTGVSLRILYVKTQDNQSLPEQNRIRLNFHRDQIWQLMLRFFEKNYALATSVSSPGAAANDFEDLFLLMEDISRIYQQIDDQVRDLRAVIEQIRFPLPEALQPFKTLLICGDELLRAVIAQQPEQIRVTRLKLQETIRNSKLGRLQISQDLRALGIAFEENEEQAIDHGIEYGELLLARTRPEALQTPHRKGWNRLPNAYHHYNRSLIDSYNHHKYGLTSYYNSLIHQTDHRYPLALDLTPVLLIIRPREPDQETRISPPQPAGTPEEKVFTLASAPTNNLVFLIDVSASMGSSDKLPLLKENLEFLITLFRPDDQIAIVTFAGDATVMLEATSGMFPAEISTAIRHIRTGGETRVKKGFREAYRIAEEAYIFNGNNRVILITDGIFQTDRSLETTISRAAGKGIQLSVMLLGKREAPQVQMRLSQLSRLGEGQYSHVTATSARELLVNEATGE